MRSDETPSNCAQQVSYLISHLPPGVCAAAVGAPSVEVIEQWGAGEALPDLTQSARIANLHEIAHLWLDAHPGDGDLLEGWLLSPNPHLGDRSALVCIREDQGEAARGAMHLMLS